MKVSPDTSSLGKHPPSHSLHSCAPLRSPPCQLVAEASSMHGPGMESGFIQAHNHEVEIYKNLLCEDIVWNLKYMQLRIDVHV